MKNQTVYRIYGVIDTETATVKEDKKRAYSYPILYQIGTLKEGVRYQTITPENVENSINYYAFRYYTEFCAGLDNIVNDGLKGGFCPIVAIHNLSFDMWSLAPWLKARAILDENGCYSNIKVCGRSASTPIFIVLEDAVGKPLVKFWDTVSFFQKSLAVLGAESGYKKATGDWDYSLIRTPETPLTELELKYAFRDICTLFCALSHFLQVNTLIPSDTIGSRIVTKTGVVRFKCSDMASSLKLSTKASVEQQFMKLCYKNKADSEEQLCLRQAANRGGFTFCAENHAGVPYNFENTDKAVMGIDATSMHPAMMVSHYMPVDFKEASQETLQHAVDAVLTVPVKRAVDNFMLPFKTAFHAKIAFEALRPKKGSVFERDGIYCLGWSKCVKTKTKEQWNDTTDLTHNRHVEKGFKDTAVNPCVSFGKIKSADYIECFLTEIELWVVSQVYDFDSCTALFGEMTRRFKRPPLKSLVSVHYMLAAKTRMKALREKYKTGAEITEKADDFAFIPKEYFELIRNHDISMDTFVEGIYLFTKADVNSLYGINVTNEARPDIHIDDNGFGYDEADFAHDYPKQPKVLYTYGLRIVGFSRLYQVLMILKLTESGCSEGFIHGDTDSLSFILSQKNVERAAALMQEIGHKVEEARLYVCAIATMLFPEMMQAPKQLGYYVTEYLATQYCCSGNKTYVKKENGEYSLAMAGFPKGGKSSVGIMQAINKIGEREDGWKEIVRFISGNKLFHWTITGYKGHFKPKWATMNDYTVTDYMGHKSSFTAPAVETIAETNKCYLDTRNRFNLNDCETMRKNNPDFDMTNEIYLFLGGLYYRANVMTGERVALA